jgi:hypothetical protein
VVVVSRVEFLVEAAEEGGHGEVHAAMAVVYGRIDEDGLLVVVAEEVAAPQITVEEGGRLGWEEIGQMPIEALEMLLDGIVEEAGVISFSELGLEAALNEEIGPGGVGGVVLVEAAYIVVFVLFEAELGLCDPVKVGELFAENGPKVPGWRGLLDPFQDQQLPFIQGSAGYCERYPDDILLSQ